MVVEEFFQYVFSEERSGCAQILVYACIKIIRNFCPKLMKAEIYQQL